jgi:DTW domain-containing protein YfiP
MLAAMSIPSRPRRAICATCLRPQPTCICQWIAPLATRVEVLVLQHPLEVSNAKGSARLLHLSLPGSLLVVGETFDQRTLSGLLHQGGRTPVLLYPDAIDAGATPLPAPPPLDSALLAQPSALRLVVLDGTWRKSRKMLYLNPPLQTLPRLALQGMPASHYRIRKAHAPDQLSTLEATAYALMRMDGGEAHEFQIRPLLDAFDGFVAQQAGYTRRP